MKPFADRELRAIIILLIVLAASCALWSIQHCHPTLFMPEPDLVVGDSQEPAEIVVHIVGAVQSPGLYQLPRGARVVDALEAAGGATDDADLALLNQASVLADGRQVTVPKKTTQAANSIDGSPAPPHAFPIPLNTATQSELEAIPGIGPVTAQRILDYRDTQGGFSSMDELLEVHGIGSKTLERLKDYLVVYR